MLAKDVLVLEGCLGYVAY